MERAMYHPAQVNQVSHLVQTMYGEEVPLDVCDLALHNSGGVVEGAVRWIMDHPRRDHSQQGGQLNRGYRGPPSSTHGGGFSPRYPQAERNLSVRVFPDAVEQSGAIGERWAKSPTNDLVSSCMALLLDDQNSGSDQPQSLSLCSACGERPAEGPVLSCRHEICGKCRGNSRGSDGTFRCPACSFREGTSRSSVFEKQSVPASILEELNSTHFSPLLVPGAGSDSPSFSQGSSAQGSRPHSQGSPGMQASHPFGSNGGQGASPRMPPVAAVVESPRGPLAFPVHNMSRELLEGMLEALLNRDPALAYEVAAEFLSYSRSSTDHAALRELQARLRSGYPSLADTPFGENLSQQQHPSQQQNSAQLSPKPSPPGLGPSRAEWAGKRRPGEGQSPIQSAKSPVPQSPVGSGELKGRPQQQGGAAGLSRPAKQQSSSPQAQSPADNASGVGPMSLPPAVITEQGQASQGSMLRNQKQQQPNDLVRLSLSIPEMAHSYTGLDHRRQYWCSLCSVRSAGMDAFVLHVRNQTHMDAVQRFLAEHQADSASRKSRGRGGIGTPPLKHSGKENRKELWDVPSFCEFAGRDQVDGGYAQDSSQNSSDAAEDDDGWTTIGGGGSVPRQVPGAPLSILQYYTDGVVFGCTNGSFDETMQRQLFGLRRSFMSVVKSINKRTAVFLFNHSSRQILGVFQARCPGEENVEPHAWATTYKPPAKVDRVRERPVGGATTPLGAQLRVVCVHEFPRLDEQSILDILPINPGTGKFNVKLNRNPTRLLIQRMLEIEKQRMESDE